MNVAEDATPPVAIRFPFKFLTLVISGLLNSHWCTLSLAASTTFRGAAPFAAAMSALVPATVNWMLPANSP